MWAPLWVSVVLGAKDFRGKAKVPNRDADSWPLAAMDSKGAPLDCIPLRPVYAGGVVGGVCGGLLVAGLGFFIYKRRQAAASGGKGGLRSSYAIQNPTYGEASSRIAHMPGTTCCTGFSSLRSPAHVFRQAWPPDAAGATASISTRAPGKDMPFELAEVVEVSLTLVEAREMDSACNLILSASTPSFSRLAHPASCIAVHA